jgi:endonuclease/exonuclease/phosphatase family metal-dependent hydrolase
MAFVTCYAYYFPQLFEEMTLIQLGSWNIGGALAAKWPRVRESVRGERWDFLAFQETGELVPKDSEWGFINSVENLGRISAHNPERWRLTHNSIPFPWLLLTGYQERKSGLGVFIANVYFSVHPEIRQEQWENTSLWNFPVAHDALFVFMGDFNSILGEGDSVNGREGVENIFSRRSSELEKQFLSNRRLHDNFRLAQPVGGYTRERNGDFARRLDRIMTSCSDTDKASVLLREPFSDHSLVSCQIKHNFTKLRNFSSQGRRRPFIADSKQPLSFKLEGREGLDPMSELQSLITNRQKWRPPGSEETTDEEKHVTWALERIVSDIVKNPEMKTDLLRETLLRLQPYCAVQLPVFTPPHLMLNEIQRCLAELLIPRYRRIKLISADMSTLEKTKTLARAIRTINSSRAPFAFTTPAGRAMSREETAGALGTFYAGIFQGKAGTTEATREEIRRILVTPEDRIRDPTQSSLALITCEKIEGILIKRPDTASGIDGLKYSHL